MGFTEKPVVLTWGGVIGITSPNDIWQCSLKLALGRDATTGDLPDPAALSDLYDIVTTMHTAADSRICQGAVLQFVKAHVLNTDGTVDGDPVLFEGTPQEGVSGDGGASPQDSMCVSLHSGDRFGRANHGRYYLPWSAIVVGSGGGFIDSSAIANLLAVQTTFLQAVNTWAAANVDPSALIAIFSAAGSGLTKVAQSVSIGNVKDTQRRRRNAIAETYQSAAL